MATCTNNPKIITTHNDNLETYCLVWLDAKVNELCEDNIVHKQQLRRIINHLKIFNNVDECQKYVDNVLNGDRIVLIISSQLSQEIVSRIHDLRQVSCIYVYNNDRDDNLTILNFSQKVKTVDANLNEIIKKLELDYHHQTRRRHQEVDDSISINVFNVSIDPDQSSTGLNGEFMFSQLLIDTLLRMTPNETDKNELLAVCEKEYSGNIVSLATLEEFKRTYSPEHAFLWYTKESFFYRLLNKALRTQNIDFLFLFRFFIRDIYEQLQQHQCLLPIRVYRGQIISVEELFVLQTSVGQLISMNSFLSTSISRELALFYLGDSTASDDLSRILFEIDADPRLDNAKPFANITAQSYFPGEDEILMMLGSIFRVESIIPQQEKENQLFYIVRLTLCNNNSHDSKPIYELMKSEIDGNGMEEPSLREFGDLLNDMGKFNEADKYLHRLLSQLPSNHPDCAHCYHGLGEAAHRKGEYQISLEWLQKGLEIRMRTLPSDHEDIANSHNSIGLTLKGNGDYKLALESYNKALAIWQRIHGENHPRVAWCLNNMGVVYEIEKKYTESLECHRKALLLQQKHFPVDHPDIAASLHNIGDVYCSLGQYDTALEYYERALNILQKSRPNQHPDIGYTLGSIGLLYENEHKLEQSLTYLQKSLDIYQEILSTSHPGRVRVENSVLRVTKQIDSVRMTSR